MVSGLHPATISPCSDSISLRLPYAVNLATECKSLTHYTKGTPSLHFSRAPTVCMHTVSGSISLPFRGSFRLSLTVLVHYRSISRILALEDGPPMFRQDFSCPALLVVNLVPQHSFRIRGYHPLSPDFPDCSAKSIAIINRLFPFRSPLLWESRLISFPAAT